MITDWLSGLKLAYDSFTTEAILLSIPISKQLKHCLNLLKNLIAKDPATSAERPSTRSLQSFLKGYTRPYLVLQLIYTLLRPDNLLENVPVQFTIDFVEANATKITITTFMAFDYALIDHQLFHESNGAHTEQID